MCKLAKGVYSKKTRSELSDLLTKTDSHKRAVISDFDGTLFRGTTGHFLHGISISYLSLYLLPLMIKSPIQEMQFIKHNLDVIDLLRKGKAQHDPDRRTKLEKKVVTNYCNTVLKGVSYDNITSASRVLQYHIYHKSLDLFSTLADTHAKSAIITKTIKPIVDNVEKKLRRTYNIHPTIIANELETLDGKVTGLDESRAVFTRYDKASYAYEFLMEQTDITHAIILGDTSEDTGMFDVARELYGANNVLTIALHPKDQHIREQADCIVTDIPSFNKYICSQETGIKTYDTSQDNHYLQNASLFFKRPF